jgi:hypothetical protein
MNKNKKYIIDSLIKDGFSETDIYEEYDRQSRVYNRKSYNLLYCLLSFLMLAVLCEFINSSYLPMTTIKYKTFSFVFGILCFLSSLFTILNSDPQMGKLGLIKIIFMGSDGVNDEDNIVINDARLKFVIGIVFLVFIITATEIYAKR